MTIKYEDLTPQQIINNYIRLKDSERQRNRKAYNNLQNNFKKYNERLNSNLMTELNRLDTIKHDPVRLAQHKEQRKLINKRAYEKRKNKDLLNSSSTDSDE
jgi:predicted acyltransferase (DUF342 family)